MKILIAPDSFKNALSALDVAKSIKIGLLKSLPQADVETLPMADGGEGTVESLIDATGGRLVKTEVCDPLLRKIQASFGVTGDGNTAVIEMAAASGIQLVSSAERNPWITSTRGTGELILAALDQGCRQIIIGIGGSATNDCGAGMARALGVKFTGADGEAVGEGGGALAEVKKIDVGGLDPRIMKCNIKVACDVTNPLTGLNGASHIYGPQKGADDAMVRKLDSNLSSFAGIIRKDLGVEVENIPGAGAAGGLGAGLIAFLQGELAEGVPLIAERIGFEEKVHKADLIITGEGGMDYQTQYGKTPYGVAQIAKAYNKPVIGVAGTLGDGFEALYEKGFDAIFSILDSPMTLDEAIRKTPSLLESAGVNIGNLLKLGKRL